MKTSILAEKLGISQQMCNRLKKRGMPSDSLHSAIEWRKRNLDVTQTKSWRVDRNQGMKPETCTLEELHAAVSNTQLNLDGNDADELYKNARALREKAAALQAAAEHQKFIDELVERADVDKIVFERARQFRDSLMNLARRLAPELAGNTDISAIESILTNEHRQILIEFSKLPVIER